MNFDWDSKKAASNIRKHGVTFEEAVTVFADPFAVIVEDAVYHDRQILIGMSSKRLLFTVFVEIDDDNVRIISAARTEVL